MFPLPFTFVLRATGIGPVRGPCHGAWSATRVIILLATISAATTARAAAYEGFDYPVRTAPATWTGGTGFASGWSTSNGLPTVAAGSLSDPTGTLATSGNRIEFFDQFWANRAVNERPGTAGGE